MPLYPIAILVGVLFLAAYFIYGNFLSRQVTQLNDAVKTPACEINDGEDYVPAEKNYLLSQHFSAISAAGPIVGPILGGLWFGWLPVLLWIVCGCIFFGAVHDFASLIGSVRHGAVSIVDIVRKHLGQRGHLFFMAFVWLSLVYVITAFTDLTSGSFVDPQVGGGVATSSVLYLLIALVMGVALYKWKMPLKFATPLFIGLVLLAIWYGQAIPIRVPGMGDFGPQKVWNLILLAYCFAASVMPMWLLLQPRGYLGGIFLYGTLTAGLVGLFLGGETIQYPAWTGFFNERGMPLFPVLFVTVACGACSGFHGIVCSGTTSKQISKEGDCRLIGYGGMLLEGIVALVALSTLMILSKSDPLAAASPDRIYAEGLSRFVGRFGLPVAFAKSFALLAFTTFIYDTLDVATRLARYILQEMLGWKGHQGKYTATFITLIVPLLCVSLKMTDAAGSVIPAWKVFWTIFGTSNQLLAGLTLMILSIWLYKNRKPWLITAIPMVFLLVSTLLSLVMMIQPNLVGVIAVILCALSLLLLAEAVKTLRLESKRSLDPQI
jgi:carbon starvation protein